MTPRPTSIELSARDRAVRRRTVIEATPALLLGLVALTLGSENLDGGRKIAWVATSIGFTLALVTVVVLGFFRNDEFHRRIQLEAMAVGFVFVVAALQVASILSAVDLGTLRQYSEPIVMGGIIVWLLVADLRTRRLR